MIDTLLLKLFWKSRLTLLQVLLDSWSSCRGDPPKQYQSQLKPLAQWLAVVSWADTACSCWWYFLIFCEFSAIFCRWTNSNLHSVAKHKHVRVCLRVSVSCSLGAILHKYFIYFWWFYCLSLCQSDSHFTKRSSGEYGMVWLFLRVSSLISRFRSVLALHFFPESKILWWLQGDPQRLQWQVWHGLCLLPCPKDVVNPYACVCMSYVLFFSRMDPCWCRLGASERGEMSLGSADFACCVDNFERWETKELQLPCFWYDRTFDGIRLVQDLWPKCCVRCFELWSSWGKHPSRSSKQIGIWWGASRPANVRLGTSSIPTTDTILHMWQTCTGYCRLLQMSCWVQIPADGCKPQRRLVWYVWLIRWRSCVAPCRPTKCAVCRLSMLLWSQSPNMPQDRRLRRKSAHN